MAAKAQASMARTPGGEMAEDDLVVLSDGDGRQTKAALKVDVRVRDTQMYLAFSCHHSNAEDRVLVARRTLSKRSWLGVWSNSFCEHPKPAKPPSRTLSRDGHMDAGVLMEAIKFMLSAFRCPVGDEWGTVDNEICPAYGVRTYRHVCQTPQHVVNWAWVTPAELVKVARTAPWAFIPWTVLQFSLIEDFSARPRLAGQASESAIAWEGNSFAKK